MKSKILKIIIFTLIMIMVCTSYVSATDIWSTAKSWLNIGQGESPYDPDQAKTAVSEISGILYGIGVGIGLIATAALGISYMFASSSDEKSNIKQKSKAVVIGLVILFGAVTIWRVVIDVLSGIT